MSRFRRLVVLALASVIGGCAPPPGRSASRAADAELHAAANALFAGMASRDTAALRAMFTPDARIVAVRVQEGVAPVVRTSTVSEFVASIGRSTETPRERMWDPRVEMEGDFASLWAPYDFYSGERFSHCGHDAFHFVRTFGGWKIAALSYTVRATRCETAPRTP